jgi:HK97 gp10 family phage protein
MADEWISVEVQGLKKMETDLIALGEELSKKVFPAAARKANKRFADTMRAKAPRGTRPLQKGQARLADSILQRTSVRSDGVKGATVVVLTGLRKESRSDPSLAVHGRFLEFGTVKMSAKPWMRPTFDTEKNSVLEDFSKELQAGITRAAQRAGVTLI